MNEVLMRCVVSLMKLRKRFFTSGNVETNISGKIKKFSLPAGFYQGTIIITKHSLVEHWDVLTTDACSRIAWKENVFPFMNACHKIYFAHAASAIIGNVRLPPRILGNPWALSVKRNVFYKLNLIFTQNILRKELKYSHYSANSLW